MYVHLGGDTVIRSAQLITILDYHHVEQGELLHAFLDHFTEQKRVVWIADQQTTKSIVITDEYIYVSPISSLTLQRRTKEETYE